MSQDIDDEFTARIAIEKAITIAAKCDTSTGGSIYLASQRA
jgi:hypothetical protein